jgi:hypothetical protein
MMRI